MAVQSKGLDWTVGQLATLPASPLPTFPIDEHEPFTRKPAHPLHTAVLLFSKLMYFEARDVLYKNNKFSFTHFERLKLWLDSRHRNMMTLRHVTLNEKFLLSSGGNAIARWDRTLISLGKKSPDLRTLTLSFPSHLIGLRRYEGIGFVNLPELLSQNKERIGELVVSSRTRGLKVLRIEGMKDEDVEVMMKGLRPMVEEAGWMDVYRYYDVFDELNHAGLVVFWSVHFLYWTIFLGSLYLNIIELMIWWHGSDGFKDAH
ncbi:MAG: hypothetical protein M1812_007432 [Candelaria pacifica]|nr:MAG: hypothetical protein M1812_007432 [Candelaria pacifica]